MRTSLYASLTVTILLAWLPSNLASSEFSLDFANIPWPQECVGRSYCHKRPHKYPHAKFRELLEGVQYMNIPVPKLGPRLGIVNDVGDCRPRLNDSYIYLIRDENDKVRLVAHTDNFKYNILIEECENPGEISDSRFVDTTDIHCYETTVPLLFSVLSLDGTKLESAGPSGGLPLSCSAKKMTKLGDF